MRQLACINRIRLLDTFSYRVKVILFNYFYSHILQSCAPEKLNPQATTTEPAHLEPELRNKRSYCNEKSMHLCCGQHSSQGLKVVDAVWEEETGDRIKVLKMGPGDSRSLGSRALFLRATALLFSVLASRKYLLCYSEVSLLCPRSRLPFY